MYNNNNNNNTNTNNNNNKININDKIGNISCIFRQIET